MATNHTANYELSQWEAGDLIQRTDFNEDNETIDAALKEHADGLAAVTEWLKSPQHVARVAFGTYTGNGKYGSSNKNKLTFSFKPMLVIIVPQGGGYRFVPAIMVRPATSTTAINLTNHAQADLSWENLAVSWFASDATVQMNVDEAKYCYIAIGYTDNLT